jgi:hypothetical protein
VGARESLATKNKKKSEFLMNFVFLGWWMKGKISAFICLGYGVMHATSEGGSNEGLGAISSQGDVPYNSPNLVTRFTSLMVERVYLRSTTQGNSLRVAPTKDYLQMQ